MWISHFTTICNFTFRYANLGLTIAYDCTKEKFAHSITLVNGKAKPMFNVYLHEYICYINVYTCVYKLSGTRLIWKQKH